MDHPTTLKRRGPKPVPMDVRIRRMSKPEPAGCWIWQGPPTNAGYGQMTVRTDGTMRTVSAHRVSYETFVGPIPEGLVIDHLCRVRMCVNPEHLEPVTPRENIMRSPIAPAALNARKTHCPQGHPYDEANTIVQTLVTGGPGRMCRTCQNSRQQVTA